MRKLSQHLLWLTAAALAACNSADTVPETEPDAGPVGADAAPVEEGCATPTGGPTLHSGSIEGTETWTAAGSPHVVQGTISIRNGATLVVEPCAVVQLAANVPISVGLPSAGTLIAEGTDQKPIRFEGLNGARWGYLAVQSPGSARLAHVSFEGGGGNAPSGATISVQGTGTPPATRPLAVDHVTVRASAGAGVRLARSAAFAAGSQALTIVGSGSDTNPAPLEIDEHAVGSVPDGSYTGNRRDEIWILNEWPLREDQTMRDLGVRWHVGNSRIDNLIVGGGRDMALATLTIEAGVAIAFETGTGLEIERGVGDYPASGALRALGTAEKPILFTSAAAAPQPGDWQGLWFGALARAENVVDHVRIEYSGADCGCVLSTCTSGLTYSEGAVIFTRQPPAAFISHSVVAHGAAHGFVLGYQGDYVDFVRDNTFEDMDGCRSTYPSQSSCPVPAPTCE